MDMLTNRYETLKRNFKRIKKKFWSLNFITEMKHSLQR